MFGGHAAAMQPGAGGPGGGGGTGGLSPAELAAAAAAAAAGGGPGPGVPPGALSPGYAAPMGLYAVQQGLGAFTLDAWGNPTPAGAAAAAGDPYAAFAASPAFAAAASQAALAAAAAAAAGGPAGGYLLSPAAGPGAAAAAMAAAAAAAAAGSPTGSMGLQDDVRTVFISGFPADVRDRELHNLLRYVPGYEASQMNWKTGQPQGFALFTSSAAARFAVDLVSGSSFEEGATLRAEMARKNMYLKPNDPSVKRASRPSPLIPAAPGSGPLHLPMSPTAAGAAAAAAAAGPAATALLASPQLGSPPAAGLLPMPFGVAGPLRPQGFSPVTNLRDNPPCNTLFIGNLGDNISEAELRGIMSTQPGYRQMKVVKGPRSTTAFVEFTDVTSAMLVHQTLQGAVLGSSDRGGIRIQYSKNPFGRRDEAISDPGAPASAAAGFPPSHAATTAQAHAAAVAAAASAAAAAAAAAGEGGGNGGAAAPPPPAAAPPVPIPPPLTAAAPPAPLVVPAAGGAGAPPPPQAAAPLTPAAWPPAQLVLPPAPSPTPSPLAPSPPLPLPIASVLRGTAGGNGGNGAAGGEAYEQ